MKNKFTYNTFYIWIGNKIKEDEIDKNNSPIICGVHFQTVKNWALGQNHPTLERLIIFVNHYSKYKNIDRNELLLEILSNFPLWNDR